MINTRQFKKLEGFRDYQADTVLNLYVSPKLTTCMATKDFRRLGNTRINKLSLMANSDGKEESGCAPPASRYRPNAFKNRREHGKICFGKPFTSSSTLMQDEPVNFD